MKKHLYTLNDRQYVMWFWVVLGITTLIKTSVAIYFPLTADEAYYAIWGKFFRWGYYDHTPLIGWLLHPFVYFGTSNLILRSPTILATSLIGYLIYWLLKPYSIKKSAGIAILFLLSPLDVLGVLITTDLPLILFSFLSGMFLFLALKKQDDLLFYFLSGICLGLAFFSKYFAVLLALAYFFYFLCAKKSWKRTAGFALLFVCVLPFGLENLYWNYTHAWANILFNVYNRNADMQFQWGTLALYVLIIFYIVTPVIFYYLCKYYKRWCRRQPLVEFGVLVFMFVVPFLFFFYLSAFKSIGLHWPLSFVPFIYILLMALLSHEEIIRSIQFMIVFTLLHLFIVMMFLLLPVQAFQQFGFHGEQYARVVFFMKHVGVRHQLDRYEKNYIIASPSYAKSDLMYIDSGVPSPVFGHGTVHGREGDFITDYRTMKNKNFVILDVYKPETKDYKPYFQRIRFGSFVYEGAKFYLVFGYGFKYEKYRDVVLDIIRANYWSIPQYLPHTPSFFCEKYFGECRGNPI
ncbi:MAG: glycosyltransferase family 39 protein [Pseudomonadota bacterium]